MSTYEAIKYNITGANITGIPTSAVTSGTFADARLSASSVTQHVDLTSLSASNLTSGTIPNARYGTPTFSAANLTGIPAPTNAQIKTGMGSISGNEVGATILGYRKNNNAAPAGETAFAATNAGSQILPTNINAAQIGSTYMSGTWRCMGWARGEWDGQSKATTVWTRIS